MGTQEKFDLIIRDGVIVDGSGLPRFRGDVAVRNGVIAAVGVVAADAVAPRVLDAAGAVIAPGFIDPHTHLDPQLCWDPTGSPSLQHGVTTVLIGNCSISLAPCKAEDRDALTRLFHRVEDIPVDAFHKGVTWSWERFGEFADALDPTLAINTAALVGHSSIRYHVMGPASSERAATPEEIEAMRDLLRDSLQGGAIGISTDRIIQHVTDEGKPIPSRMGTDDELRALCDVLAELGMGLLQTGPATNISETPAYVRDVLAPIAEKTRRPVLLSGTVQERGAPHRWKEIHDLIGQSQQAGGRFYTQATPCRVDGRFTFLFTLQFNEMPTWRTVLSLPHDEKVAAFKDPAIRDALQFEAVEDTRPIFFSRRWDTIEVLEISTEKNRHLVGTTVQELADRQGKRIIDALLDLVLEEDLNCAFVAIGRANGDDDAVAAQLRSAQAIVGSSDAGAHVTQMCGAGDTTLLFSRWVREKGRLTLEEAVNAVTFKPASVLGLTRRGLVRKGFAADLTVFDPDQMEYLEPYLVDDLPGGGQRLWRDSKGIRFVVVNGEVAIDESGYTGSTSGRFLRGDELA